MISAKIKNSDYFQRSPRLAKKSIIYWQPWILDKFAVLVNYHEIGQSFATTRRIILKKDPISSWFLSWKFHSCKVLNFLEHIQRAKTKSDWSSTIFFDLTQKLHLKNMYKIQNHVFQVFRVQTKFWNKIIQYFLQISKEIVGKSDFIQNIASYQKTNFIFCSHVFFRSLKEWVYQSTRSTSLAYYASKSVNACRWYDYFEHQKKNQ